MPVLFKKQRNASQYYVFFLAETPYHTHVDLPKLNKVGHFLSLFQLDIQLQEKPLRGRETSRCIHTAASPKSAVGWKMENSEAYLLLFMPTLFLNYDLVLKMNPVPLNLTVKNPPAVQACNKTKCWLADSRCNGQTGGRLVGGILVGTRSGEDGRLTIFFTGPSARCILNNTRAARSPARCLVNGRLRPIHIGTGERAGGQFFRPCAISQCKGRAGETV